MQKRFRMVKGLMMHLKREEIRILSDRIAVIRNYSRTGADEVFSGNGEFLPSHFFSRDRGIGRGYLGTGFRTLVQESFECAMACHEMLAECNLSVEDCACTRCAVVRGLANNCNQLVRHLIQTGCLSELHLLRCAAGCRATLKLSDESSTKISVKGAAACRRFEISCLEYYQKVLSN